MGFLKKLFGASQPAPNYLPIHPEDKELVKEDDIRWWESLTLDDCKLLEQQDMVAQYALFIKLVEEDGFSKEEAAKRLRKSHIFYYGTLKQRDNEPLGVIDPKNWTVY
jgi:hypothetical protein